MGRRERGVEELQEGGLYERGGDGFLGENMLVGFEGEADEVGLGDDWEA